MADRLSKLDADQVIRRVVQDIGDGELAQKVSVVTGNLVPEKYDSIELTYVTSGNGIGEIETVVYKNGGLTVATLTLTYNPDDKLSSVSKV